MCVCHLGKRRIFQSYRYNAKKKKKKRNLHQIAYTYTYFDYLSIIRVTKCLFQCPRENISHCVTPVIALPPFAVKEVTALQHGVNTACPHVSRLGWIIFARNYTSSTRSTRIDLQEVFHVDTCSNVRQDLLVCNP